MLVECINDKNKPEDIPASLWIKERRIYTAIGYYYHPIQNCFSITLEELTPPSPYIGYKSDRFKPIEETPENEWMEVLVKKKDYAI